MVPVLFRGWDKVPELGYIVPAAHFAERDKT